MIVKVFGAAMIIATCGYMGLKIAANHRQEVATAKKLLHALEYMACELKCRLTPLPELCRKTAQSTNGTIKSVFDSLADELDRQVSPSSVKCMQIVLEKENGIPKLCKNALMLLGSSLGSFHADAQISGIESIRQQLQLELNALCANQDTKLRSYQTLGICAGAAIAILLL